MLNRCVHAFVDDIINTSPKGDKQSVIDYCANKYNLTQDRKVYYCRYFAVRFSYSQNGSFSNTVLSLSALQKFDKIPFFVVLVRKNNSNIVYIANSTFLSKISHSSINLSMSNIKGSFNGSDIMKSYNGIANYHTNFDDLFAIHEGLDWDDNLLRLVEASATIIPTSQKFSPTSNEQDNIFDSIHRAEIFIRSNNLKVLSDDLNERCNKCGDALLIASHIENVNIRGRLIEFLVTSEDSERDRLMHLLKKDTQLLPEFGTHDDLGDYERFFDNGNTYTDIKTKIIYLDSAPKAYNIDKFLRKMAEEKSVFLFYLIGVNEQGVFNTVLCSVYHDKLIDASIVQHHWAGRATRGVVQFNGKVLNDILQESDFENVINIDKAESYIKMLLDR